MTSVRRALVATGAAAALAFAIAPAALAVQPIAVPCTGMHPMIIRLCPDGSTVGYTCDPVTGTWVMGTCPPPGTVKAYQ